MASTNPFENIRAKIGDTERSVNWYQTQIKALRSLQPNKLLANTPDLTNRVMPGKMYFFLYDAKTKETLPHWDMFPLVLPFRRVQGGFYAINMHYMPYVARFKLLGALHRFAVDEKINEETRIRISWNVLSRMSTIAPIKGCVKHYLDDHVQSRFLQIKYPDWTTAAMLPVEKFVGEDKQAVWQKAREAR